MHERLQAFDGYIERYRQASQGYRNRIDRMLEYFAQERDFLLRHPVSILPSMALRQIDVPLPSSNIQQVVYDDATGDLFVQFVRQGTSPYRFLQVPVSTIQAWERADSAGRYFRGNILNQFQHEVIGEFPSDF